MGSVRAQRSETCRNGGAYFPHRTSSLIDEVARRKPDFERRRPAAHTGKLFRVGQCLVVSGLTSIALQGVGRLAFASSLRDIGFVDPYLYF